MYHYTAMVPRVWVKKVMQGCYHQQNFLESDRTYGLVLDSEALLPVGSNHTPFAGDPILGLGRPVELGARKRSMV